MRATLIETKAPYLIDLNQVGSTEIGYITVAEFPSNIPFEIKRTYWTYYTPNMVERGGHGHKELEQVIIAVSGTIDFHLESIEGATSSFKLDNPNKALFVPKGYWRTIRFSHNAVLLCLASEIYDKDDYIRDYKEFKNSKT